MVTQRRPVRPRAIVPVYQLEIVLTGSAPLIWRRVLVPGNANLGWLHAVIQLAMGWTNSHLHQFRFGGQVCSDPSFELDEFEDDPKVLDENRVVLMKIAPEEGDVLTYTYDFGDSWEHRITVEQLLPPAPALAKVACCVYGAHACPPEDCGGLSGYANVVNALLTADHVEHESTKQWLGRPFDPEVFDFQSANTWLQRLRWPRMTVEQLAEVLEDRDDCGG